MAESTFYKWRGQPPTRAQRHRVERRQRNGEQITDAQLDTLRSEVTEVTWTKAHPILAAVRCSKEFKELQRHAQRHPGLGSRLAPDLLLTAFGHTGCQ